MLTRRGRWRWTPKATCSPPAAPRIPAADDFTVAKFARDGTLLWQQTLNGTANGDDRALIGGGGHRKETCSPPASPRIRAQVRTSRWRSSPAVDDTPWNFCAPEGGVCAFTGTTEVRYGADGALSTRR